MENIIIRRFKETDRDDMFNNWTSDEEVARYMLYPIHKTIEDAENAINFFASSPDVYAIEVDNMVVGSFTFSVNKKHSFAEISYNLSRKYQHKGIMSYVLNYFLNKSHEENINMVLAEVMEENIASCKLLERHGFKLDGTIRKKYKDRYGTYHNIRVYTYLVDEEK